MTRVEPVGPGFRITVPCFAKHHSGHADTITLTREEAVDLMHQLFESIVETQRQSKAGEK